MKNPGNVSARTLSIPLLVWVLGWSLVCCSPVSSQPVPVASRGIADLNGPWRFEAGDDAGWADPALDDSSWHTVTPGEPLADQGIDPYAGYAWYRLRLRPEPADAVPDLLVLNDPAGEVAVYVNGVEAGHTRGMTKHPASYWSHPFVVHLGQPAADGSYTIAVRAWSSDASALNGALNRVRIGPPEQIGEQLELATSRLWFRYVLSLMLSNLVYIGVALLGALLYLTQRHHREYLWLTLLSVSLLVRGLVEIGGLTQVISTPLAHVLDNWNAGIYMAVTLEFVLLFAASQRERSVRVLQIAAVVVPIFSAFHLELIFNVFWVILQVLYGLLVVVMLGTAWRKGRPEAGFVLFPFLLVGATNAIAEVVNFAAGKGWIPARYAIDRFSIGPVQFGLGFFAYQIFVASLIAVIFYRFIRVSQDEQRSNAEIAAARSVQSLLIPTQLPSNRNFMLESAYLPVNGVGGDFFQVLPLKDDSLLLVVGDVSGKGLQAAMNSSTLVGALRNELSNDPATILRHLNHVLLGAVSAPGAVPGLDSAPCFATCLCARIHPDGTLTIANAGHLSPYRDGRELEIEPSLPLGVIADAEYGQTTFHLERGDRLVFLSDGVVEATDQHGELFGFDRTRQVSNESARYIAQTAQRFGQTDDITVVSLYVASRAAERSNQEAVHTS
jgi:hypothetical protein